MQRRSRYSTSPTAAVEGLRVFQNQKDQKVLKSLPRSEQSIRARSRYTPREFEAALWQAEEGAPIETVCRRLGVARSTFYRWKARFAAEVDMEQWLTVQNRRLRESVGKLAGDKALLQFLLRRGD